LSSRVCCFIVLKNVCHMLKRIRYDGVVLAVYYPKRNAYVEVRPVSAVVSMTVRLCETRKSYRSGAKASCQSCCVALYDVFNHKFCPCILMLAIVICKSRHCRPCKTARSNQCEKLRIPKQLGALLTHGRCTRATEFASLSVQ
jgi:hypothetical protein